MSAYSVNPTPAIWPERGVYICAVSRWDNGKSTIVAWTEGKTEEDAVNIGAAIVLALNNAVAETTSKRMNTDQAMGPHRPTVWDLSNRINRLPNHHEVESVVINGQTNQLFISAYHEGLLQEHEFNCHD